MSKTLDDAPDDLEAVRQITDALKPFRTEEQDRIIRWAKEKIGLPLSSQAHTQEKQESILALTHPTPHKKHALNIKTFVADKNPISDTHFAATVAYYYRFEAPEAERKDSISPEELREACRQADRKRINYPSQTLNNAYKEGLLDKAGEKGRYKINTVGENLVAMTLPGGVAEKSTPRKKASNKIIKKAAPKKAEIQKSAKRK